MHYREVDKEQMIRYDTWKTPENEAMQKISELTERKINIQDQQLSCTETTDRGLKVGKTRFKTEAEN